jgi:hypothetical protein
MNIVKSYQEYLVFLLILVLLFPAYYEWSAWTTCEKECGVEFYRRARECVTPEAPFCISTETVEEESCGLEPCAGIIFTECNNSDDGSDVSSFFLI